MPGTRTKSKGTAATRSPASSVLPSPNLLKMKVLELESLLARDKPPSLPNISIYI